MKKEGGLHYLIISNYYLYKQHVEVALTLETSEKRNVSFNNMVKEAIKPIATKKNAIGAALLTTAFALGSNFGFEEYENRLERHGMETLHPYENIIFPIPYDEKNNPPSYNN